MEHMHSSHAQFFLTRLPIRSPPNLQTVALDAKNFCKIFQDFSSHRIFGHIYEALNIDKNKTNYTV
jgi:hypothetical protein